MTSTTSLPLSHVLLNGDVAINHAEVQAKMRLDSSETLRFIIQDCREALEANPDGCKAGYYQDEIHYAAMELARRVDSAGVTRFVRRHS